MAFNLAMSGDGYDAAGKFGQALNAGSGQNAALLTPPSSGTQVFTIGFWVKGGNSGAIQICISRPAVFWFGHDASGNALLHFGPAATETTLSTSAQIADGAWHYIELSFGATVYVFVDGAAAGNAPANLGNTSGGFGFAVRTFPAATSFDWTTCELDDVSVYSTQLHTSAFTPPTAAISNSAANLIALYHLDGNGTDSTGVATGGAGVMYTADNAAIGRSPHWNLTGAGASSRLTTINTGQQLGFVLASTATATLQFDMSGNDTTNGLPEICYIADEGAWTRVLVPASGVVPITFPDTSLNMHTLRVVTEGLTEGSNPSLNVWASQQNAAVFQSIGLDTGGSLLQVTLSSNIASFFTDSIGAGVRMNYSSGGDSRQTYMYAHQAWPTLVANALGLLPDPVGFGGSGIVINVGGTGGQASGQVPLAAASLGYLYSGAVWTPSANHAVAVIEQMTNDKGQSVAAATFQTAYASYVGAVRAKLPGALIVCLVMPGCGVYSAAVAAAIAGMANVVMHDYSALAVTTTDGLHFDRNEHIVFAAQLAKDIKADLANAGIKEQAASVGGGTAMRITGGVLYVGLGL